MPNQPLPTGHYTLNNGTKMPKFGLGTWLSQPGEVKNAVEKAIDAGYRHFDCAFLYGNEAEIGEAIQNKIKEGVVKREDLFITSKLWNTFHKPDNVEIGLDMTLKDLKLDYVDLYLMHFPVGFKLNTENLREIFPTQPSVENGTPGGLNFDDETHYSQTFQKLIDIKNSTKKIKALGVSNFNVQQLEILKKNCTSYSPDVNQIETHPFYTCEDLVNYCQSNKILITAYSPLGNPGSPAYLRGENKSKSDVLLTHSVINKIAEKYSKTNAHILIKFAIARGFSVIPKSVNPKRIVDNSEIFDFEIENEDIQILKGLNRDEKTLVPSGMAGSKYWPWPEGEYVE